MPTRLCPICRLGKLTRREVKTCGAYDCIQLWKSLTPSQRAQAIEEAEQYNSRPTILSGDPQIGKPYAIFETPTSPAPLNQTIPKSSTERDDEALKRLFGDDAPGLSNKPEKE